MPHTVAVLLAAAVLLAGSPASAQGPAIPGYVTPGTILTGIARIMDSDKLIVADRYLRLWAVDAPEYGQSCYLDGKPYDCNAVSYRHLEILTAEGQVTCVVQEDTSRERRGKNYAMCTASDGTVINEALVRAGNAVVFPEQSLEFSAAETAAAEEGVGMWRGSFQVPWIWFLENSGGGL